MKDGLTRRQAQVLKRIVREDKVVADYTGGASDVMDNWDFWFEYDMEGCAPSARVLIAKGFACISEPDALGNRNLIATQKGVRWYEHY